MSYRRWQQLYDRKQAGGSLSPSELAELEHLSVDDPGAREELGLVRQLEELDCEPGGDARAVLERTLSEVAALDKVVPIRGRLGSRPGTPCAPQRRLRAGWWRSRGMWGALAIAAAGLLVVSASPLFGDDEVATSMAPVAGDEARPELIATELTLAAGEVFVNGKPSVVTALAVEPGSSVVVQSGRACLAIDSKTDVCLDRDTEVILDDRRKGAARLVRLVRGRVAAALEERPAERRFSIVSGGLEATALGTAFSVESGSDGPAKVTVMEGVVRVSLADHVREVAVNEQLSIAQGKLTAPRSITRAERLRHSSLIEVRKLWRDASVAILHVEAAPGAALVSLDGVILGHAPLSVVATSGQHQLSANATGYQSYQQQLQLSPGQTERVSVPALVLASKGGAAVSKEAPPSKVLGRGEPVAGDIARDVPSAETLLARARSLVQAGRWHQAVAAYQKLRALHPRSPESHTVLVALGQLELDRLGQPARALGSFNRYLRFGGGLAQEAAFGKVRALRALGNPIQERAAIEAYVRRYPGSADARALKRRLAELERASTP